MADPYTAAGPVTIRDLSGQVLRTEAAHKARHKPTERAPQPPTQSLWPTTAWQPVACTSCGHIIQPGQTLWTTATTTLCKACHQT